MRSMIVRAIAPALPLLLVSCSAWQGGGASTSGATSGLTAFHTALEAGDYDAAERAAATIVESDASAGPELAAAFDAAREREASGLVERARTSLASGDEGGALDLAGRVTTEFAETDAASSARELIAGLVGPDVVVAEGDELVRVSSGGADARIGKAEKYLERGESRRRKALATSGSSARGLFESSASDFEKALDALDGVAKDADASADQRLAAQQMTSDVKERAVGVNLSLAQFHLSRGSHPQAREAVESARAIAPAHDGVTAMERRIESNEAAWADQKTLRKLGGKKWRERPANG